MAQITKNQKKYISSLAEDLSDDQFNEVIDATSYVQKQTFSKNRTSTRRSKTQIIAGLNTQVASEVIELLKSPVFIESIRLLDASKKKPAKTPRGQRTISSKKKSMSRKGSANNTLSRTTKTAKDEHVPFSEEDRKRLHLDDLQRWADEHNKNAVTVLTRQDINKAQR